jgi:hypothetical protein
MIRMLLVLVIVGLGLVLVSNSLKRVPETETGGQSARTVVQEAEQVKTLLEGQQQMLEQRADRYRDVGDGVRR